MTEVSRFSSVVTRTTSTAVSDVEQDSVGGQPGQGVTACSEQVIFVGDQTDQQQPSDQDEGRPVLGGRGPGLVRGEQCGGEEESAPRRSRCPAPHGTVPAASAVTGCSWFPTLCIVGLCPALDR